LCKTIPEDHGSRVEGESSWNGEFIDQYITLWMTDTKKVRLSDDTAFCKNQVSRVASPISAGGEKQRAFIVAVPVYCPVTL
jgi:hypothetical protein